MKAVIYLWPICSESFLCSNVFVAIRLHSFITEHTRSCRYGYSTGRRDFRAEKKHKMLRQCLPVILMCQQHITFWWNHTERNKAAQVLIKTNFSGWLICHGSLDSSLSVSSSLVRDVVCSECKSYSVPSWNCYWQVGETLQANIILLKLLFQSFFYFVSFQTLQQNPAEQLRTYLRRDLSTFKSNPNKDQKRLKSKSEKRILTLFLSVKQELREIENLSFLKRTERNASKKLQWFSVKIRILLFSGQERGNTDGM